MVKSKYKNTCDGAAAAAMYKYIANIGLQARENQNQGSIETRRGNKWKQCSQQSRDLKIRPKKQKTNTPEKPLYEK